MVRYWDEVESREYIPSDHAIREVASFLQLIGYQKMLQLLRHYERLTSSPDGIKAEDA